jgi:hypothetical protein
LIRKFLLGLLVLTLTGCGMLPVNSVAPATPLPTFASTAAAGKPAAGSPQASALGGKQIGDLFVWIYSNPNPPIRGTSTLDAYLTDASGKPITDAKISFDLDMTNMSHGKNVVAAKPTTEGHYSGNVSFLMPGPWRVIVGIDRGGTTHTVRFDFNVNSR